MSDSPPTGPKVTDAQTAWQQASDWFGRTIAIVLVMVGPGLAGGWVDKQLETKFFTMIGFAFGMGLAVVSLIIFMKIKPIDGNRPMPTRTEPAQASVRGKDDGHLPPSERALPHLPGAEVIDRD